MTADFADMVAGFSVPGVQLIEYGPGAYGTDGRYVQGSPTLTDIVASVQSPTPAMLKRMPEGLRVEDTIVVYTPNLLSVSPKANRVQYAGVVYEVQSLFDWSANGNYVGAFCTKVVAK